MAKGPRLSRPLEAQLQRARALANRPPQRGVHLREAEPTHHGPGHVRHHQPWREPWVRLRLRVGVDVKVILTPPFIFCIDNPELNIQGGVRMTLTSRATCVPGCTSVTVTATGRPSRT